MTGHFTSYEHGQITLSHSVEKESGDAADMEYAAR